MKKFTLLVWSLFGKQVKTDYQEKYRDADKPAWLSRRKLSLLPLAASLIIGANAVYQGEPVTAVMMMTHLQALVDAGMDIWGILMSVKGSLAFAWFIVLLVVGIVFKSKK